MERIAQNGLVYYRFHQWQNITHGVFTRIGGVSAAPFAALNLGGNVGDDPAAVRENHVRMYAALGVEDERACTVWQVHSADVVVVRHPLDVRRWLARADALVTDKPGLPLSMRFADCTPLLFHDPVRGVIGMAHAGWRGTVQGVGARTVKTMVDTYGCKPCDIQAAIGPSIGPERYQVGEEVVAAAYAYFGTLTGFIHRDPHDNTAYFDLWAANALDLRRMGVEQIEIAGMCTASNTAEFYSHRAEKGATGRFGAVMSL
ncbi:MAG: peptidoglycan editing factor PgeF [Chloroflexota bacterium]|nr:peptidoglycan editing factor PgeF [Chloroflexota bacterium]